MKRIIITGGTGFIGTLLSKKAVESDMELTILTRNPEQAVINHKIAHKYINLSQIQDSQLSEILSKSDILINLAGTGIADKAWTKEYKESIIKSRTGITKRLANSAVTAQNKDLCFISASAVGYYGNRGDEILTEQSAPGTDFLAEVCEKWEQASAPAKDFSRLVNARIGIVLHPKAGALAKMLIPYKYFAGGAIGSGNQWMPWIHVDDLLNLFWWIIENKSAKGIFNITSPMPVQMSTFAHTLGKALKRPSFMNVPEFAIKKLLGESASMVLNSQRAIPEKSVNFGYRSLFTNLDEALIDLFQNYK